MSEPTLLFENGDLLVFDKPAGVLVHGEEDLPEGSVAEWLVSRVPEIESVGENSLRPGIVHRLDRDTSGVMVAAKNQETYLRLKKQFQARQIQKTYQALVWGIVKDDRGQVDRAIGKSGSDIRLRSTGAGTRGEMRAALTYYKTLERFPLEDISFLELYPKTGRTHQIRIHMQSIRHPIVCDSLYGKGKRCPLFDLSRQALHALSLGFELPSGERYLFTAPLPKEFENTLIALRGSTS